MRDISVKCWDLACGSNEQQAMVNYAGFLILPGLLSVMRKIRGGQKPIDFLVKTAAEDFPGRVIKLFEGRELYWTSENECGIAEYFVLLPWILLFDRWTSVSTKIASVRQRQLWPEFRRRWME
jgi:hypothetical protein